MTLPDTIMTLIPQEKALESDVTQAHNTGLQEKENQIQADAGMTEDNARDQVTLSTQEETTDNEDNARSQMTLLPQAETPDNEDNESQIEQQATLSNEDNNECTLLTKQSSNKTSYTTIAIGCAFLAVGCLVAAAIMQSLVLLGIGALLIIGAAITSYLTPSTKMESTNINAHVNVEQTL